MICSVNLANIGGWNEEPSGLAGLSLLLCTCAWYVEIVDCESLNLSKESTFNLHNSLLDDLQDAKHIETKAVVNLEENLIKLF